MINLKEAIIYLDGISGDEATDIRRCLTTLYSVKEGEQPLDRGFGISWEFMDQPMPIAQNILALEIIKKTNRYETRVSVDKVEYEHGDEGQLIPAIHLKRGDV